MIERMVRYFIAASVAAIVIVGGIFLREHPVAALGWALMPAAVVFGGIVMMMRRE